MTATPLDALVRGSASAAGTLVLHGAGGTPELNVPFLNDLARGGRVVAPYYPGTGPSPRATGPLRLDDLVDRAVAAADAAGLERFDLLGYSLGCAVAVRLATRHPNRVTRLVLTAGIACASPSLRLACGVWITLLQSSDPLALGRFLAWASSSEGAWAQRPGDPDETALAIAAAAPAGSADQADLVRRVDVRGDLRDVRAPTLVVVPRQDRLVDPTHSAQLAAGIAGARVVEVEGGHDVAGEAAQPWWAAVAAHFALIGGERGCA